MPRVRDDRRRDTGSGVPGWSVLAAYVHDERTESAAE